MVGRGMRAKRFHFLGSPVGLFCWSWWESTGVWPQGLLDAYIARSLRVMVILPLLVRGPFVFFRLIMGWGLHLAWASAGVG